MKRTVKIGTKNVEMVANAASPIFFRQCFGEDFKLIRQKLYQMDKEDAAFSSGLEELFEKMGYIMAKQAEGTHREASYDDFIAWMEDFAPLDLELAVQDIVTIYHEQEKTVSVPKK